MRHLMSPLDLSVDELNTLLDLASDIEKHPDKYAHVCDDKRLATLFYEPSTRTRLSFEAAMMNLGGKVLGFSSADSSSASKGESVADTIRVVSCYADICAMRHPKEGAPLVASMASSIPVINAGDGGHQHPAQTLTDLLTIRSLKGRLDNLTIGLCGDLKFGRTVHSLIEALVRYTNVKFILISPEELRIPSYIREDVLKKNNIEFQEVERLEDALPDLDILYMTRVQKERFFNEEDYVRMKDFYILDKQKMELAKKDMYVLHPLPRVNEISTEVDADPRAAYFKQAQYGVYVRMALIHITGGKITMLNVGALREGYVLDHIKAGKAMTIYHDLKLDKLDCTVAIIKNARSNKMGKKDIIKVECPVENLDLDILGFIDHNITVNVIKDEKIVAKKELKLPNQVVNVIKCKNPRCITSIEQGLDQIFVLADKEKEVYRCKYCEEKYTGKRNK